MPNFASMYFLAAVLLSAEVNQSLDVGLGFIGMALATGLACLGAGIAVAATGTAAIASTTEKPEIFARVLIFAGLGEGIAIYGLLTALLVWINLPSLVAH